MMATVEGVIDELTPSKANPNLLPFAQQMFTRPCHAEGTPPPVNAEHKLQVRLRGELGLGAGRRSHSEGVSEGVLA